MSICEKTELTINKVIILWHLAKGFIPLPKSINEDRIQSNINVEGLLLSPEDIEAID